MSVFFLELRAPFAAFRWLQAGVYRATSPVIPPSAAWGLVLNLAGIETRGADGATTAVRTDAPELRLAIGSVGEPQGTLSLFQQLHSYPVGNSGKDLKPRTHGAKHWIAPGRREYLVDFHAVVGVDDPSEQIAGRVERGLAGALASDRYGLPFAGENSCLFDHIELKLSCSARWYCLVDDSDDHVAETCRLTTTIDRTDSSRTVAPLFAPTEVLPDPPPSAWVSIPTVPVP